MSSIKTTQLDGDVSIGRNLAIGGNETIQGNSHIKGRLVVDGWLIAQNVIGPSKGLFTTLEALQTAYPNPKDGWYAYVGDSLPAAIYVASNGSWTATGGTGGTEALILTELEEMIEQEAQTREDADNSILDSIDEISKEIWQLALTFSLTPSVIEVGVSTSVTLSWGVKQKEADVTSKCSLTLNGNSVSGTSKTETLSPSAEGTTTYTLSASYDLYGGLTASSTKEVKSVYASYFGSVSNDWEVSSENILALTKNLQSGKGSTKSGIVITNGKIAYAYPASFGLLTSIKDGNGYEVLDSYTRHDVTVGGVKYYCYLLTTEVSAEDVTQIYQ